MTLTAADLTDTEAWRFWQTVQWSDECWLYGGAKYDYGVVLGGERGTARAHRLAYELTYGPIPPGLWVLHRCDNPPCVRPDHLFLGTALDNARDCIAKGRRGQQRHRRPPPARGAPGGGQDG